MITAKDIADVVFSKPPLGKRGYNEDEVDQFLDVVQDDVGRYISQIEELTSRETRQLLAPTDPPVQATPAPPPPPEPEPPFERAARILELAENTAEQLTREAESAAAQTVSEARTQAAKMIASAQTTVAEIEERIETLRIFEKTYRERLDGYISGQLDTLRASSVVAD